MIQLDWLRELIEYSIYSSLVANENPVSLLIVADPEMGKTKMVESFSNNSSVAYLSDFTRFGIIRDWLPRMRQGEIRTIIVPDLVQLIGGKERSSADGVITFLNSITEEGLKSISTFGISFDLPEALKISFIGCIPRQVFLDKRSAWRRMGFISRTLPISYNYSKETVAEILGYITRGLHTSEPLRKLSIPSKPAQVCLGESLALQILPLTIRLADALGERGFRLQRHFQVLCKARALSLGKSTVDADDVQRIIELAAWVNLDFNVV